MYHYLINDLKISSRLTTAFAFLLLLVVLLGGLALESTITLNALMKRISDHPLTVIYEAQQAKNNVLTIQRDMLALTHAEHTENTTALISDIQKVDQELDNHLAIVRSQYLGSTEDITQLTQALNDWRRLLKETVAQVQAGSSAEIITKIVPEQQRYSAAAETKFQDILTFAHAKAKSLREAADTEKERVITQLIAAMFGLVLLGTLITWFISRSITQPLEQLRQRMTALASGDLSVEIPFQEGSSELTAIARAVQVFKEAVENLESQRWIKTTISEISTLLQSTTTPLDFARLAINELVPKMGGGAGVFYLWDDASESLQLLGSYGFKKRRHLATTFKLGEGLVGQCALEHAPIILTEVPDDYARITSGIGEAPPRTILVAPILVKDKVLAVIEIGSFVPFTSQQQLMLDEVLPIIALNLEVLERNNRTRMLLEQTQQQAEELGASEEELRNQSDQLQIVNEELRHKSDNLQQQSEELRASEEELRAANDELEEKSRGLEEQAKLLEKARAESEQRALERDTASRYKSEFLANMSHELRTPLNSLLILARALHDNEEGNLTEDQIESAGIIHESGTSLLRLINDILDLSKVEAGKMQIAATDIDLDSFSNSLLQHFSPLAQTNGLTLTVNKAADVPKYLHSDRGKLDQIINNLLGNALKFTEQGSVGVNIKHPTEATLIGINLTPAEAIAIEITDTGIGIPTNKIDSIFHAFEQVDGSSSRPYGGTGLGLTISRRLAQFLGGDIQVASHLGKGSTFTLLLPLTLQNAITKPTATPSQRLTLSVPTSTPSLSTGYHDDADNIMPDDETILIIEDDTNFAKIVCDISRKRGFKCLLAEDGVIGLELAKHYRPTGIVLDVDLPRMDGWTVMERLKEQPETRHIPVHFMSATDSQHRGMAMGAVGYFTKPISKEQIESAFQRIRHFAASGNRKILLVDDDVATQKAVTVLLNNTDVNITTETTGTAALKRLENGEQFDCLILDLGLPDISGLSLLEACTHKQLIMPPVIVYSGRDLSEPETLALREYTDSIVIKGARSPERLLDEVTLFLHSVHHNQAASQLSISQPLHDKEARIADRTVLVVDDDMRNTFALSKVLRAKGLNVLMAQDGLKALSQLAEKPEIDLVLMDIMMPGMDGYTTIQEIRKQAQFQKLPVIALTAKAMLGDRDKCLAAGADDYLSKPVDIDDLMAMIRHYLLS